VVNLHRAGVDVRLKRVIRVRQCRKCKSHKSILFL
jgi:hypothetical protein